MARMESNKRKSPIKANGITREYPELSHAEYKKLDRQYKGEISKYFPYEMARRQRNILHIEVDPIYAVLTRFLGIYYKEPQAKIIEALFDTLKSHKLKLELDHE